MIIRIIEVIEGKIYVDKDMNFINENEMVCAPNVPKKWLQMLKKANFKVVDGKKEIGKKYPETIPYNAVGIGKDSLVVFH